MSTLSLRELHLALVRESEIARNAVAELSEGAKVMLVESWLSLLGGLADRLCDLWERLDVRRDRMIVDEPDEATSWNETAALWNEAREQWMTLLDVLGMNSTRESMCLGKVPALTSREVAAWYHAMGGKLDRDTDVWAELPLPWEVLSGKKKCTRASVEAICKKHGVDPISQGWTAPPGRDWRSRRCAKLLALVG